MKGRTDEQVEMEADSILDNLNNTLDKQKKIQQRQ
jgi:hypothetical protein